MAGSARITRALHRILGSACVAVLLVLGAAPSATAENAYWQGQRDAIWGTGIDPLNGESNWYTKPVGGTARNPPKGAAIFAQGPRETKVRIEEHTNVASLIIEPNNSVYTFTVTAGRVLRILGAGIFNKDPTTPRFSIFGELEMRNEARFSASASLKSALIRIRPDGRLRMTGISRGGNAEVENSKGGITFSGLSSADRMKITNTHEFGTIDGGYVAFFGRSTGGDARFVNHGYGRLEFIMTEGPLGNGVVTAGDIYSDGAVYVGTNTLIVADNFKIGTLPGLHELFIDGDLDKVGSIHVKGNLDLGHQSRLILRGTFKRQRFLILRYEGTKSGSINLVSPGFNARLEYLPNEIWLVVV